MDDVVLLHGLGRDQRIMQPLSMQLQRHHFCTHNISYPSTQYSIERLAAQIYQKVARIYHTNNQPIHFVLHSLGAIIVRYMLQHYDVGNLGRVVMIAPPNQGSDVATFFKRFFIYKKMYGPTGQQLVTGPAGMAAQLPDADYELGIIAGNRCTVRDCLFSWFLFEGDNDGKVSVASTRLAGMKQHIVLPLSHPLMPRQQVVIEQSLAFIQSGAFSC
jgi:triacylglycerol lipase